MNYRLLPWVLWRLAGSLLLLSSDAFSQSQYNDQKSSTQINSQTLTPLKLGLPIDCTLGKDCHILAYFDEDTGPEFKDFGGGRQTYNGHDGTDFAIASAAVMAQGVAVKAAAAGTVMWVRDGVADKRVENEQQARDISALGCGNSVIIRHPNAWRTYYCHLRNGSLNVKPGMQVVQGTVLGMVGNSGLASYPHVHFGVLHQGQKIDPFSPKSLWQEPVSYVATGVISAGFSQQKEDIHAVWQGVASPLSLKINTPAIFFWVHPFGVIAGDIEKLRLIDPDGQPFMQSEVTVKSSNRINRVSVIGQPNISKNLLKEGTWQGTYQLYRNEKLLIDIQRMIEIENL